MIHTNPDTAMAVTPEQCSLQVVRADFTARQDRV
jgi:hypothetical protein